MPDLVCGWIFHVASIHLAVRAIPKAEQKGVLLRALQTDDFRQLGQTNRAAMTWLVESLNDPATLKAMIDLAKYQLALLQQQQAGERRGQFNVIEGRRPGEPE